jgi:hypothetical protein
VQKDRFDWQSSIDKLLARISSKFNSEVIRKLIKLNSSYISENSNGKIEPSIIKLLRSIDRRIKSSNNIFLDEFTKLVDLITDHPVCFLPSDVEFNDYILTPIGDLEYSYPYSQISLSLSSPVAFPEKPSINIVKRYFDCDLELKLKLKLGIFLDDQGNLYWETGFIFPEKSIKQLCKNISDKNTQMLISSSTLKKIVDNIFEMVKQKKIISGIDLTPAHYHILPFSIRLGGKLMDPDRYNKYKYNLFESIDYTMQDKLNCNDCIYQFAKSQYLANKKLDTITVSMMLYKKLIFKKDSKQIFCWIPPRVIMARS